MSTSEQRSTPRLREANTFWSRLSPMARHGVSVGLMLAIALSFYAPMIFEGKAIHSSDKVGWEAKVHALTEHYEETGERALWNPNVYSGMPAFMMNYKQNVIQIDDVADKMRSFAWPVSHLFFLLIGMYLLLFYLTRNHLSGLLAAFAFGFTTYIPVILSAGHNTKFIALCYAPYVVLAFVYALRNPSLLSGLLFAVALGAELRAKHPQITYSVLMMLLVWWIVEAVWAWQEDEVTPFAKSTGWLALGTGVALLMVAQPYFAIYQYKQFSVRGAEAVAGAGGAAQGGGGGMGGKRGRGGGPGRRELVTRVIAGPSGGGPQTYWGPKIFTAGPHYVGGVVAALSGLALWRVRSRVTWGIGAGVLVTILFSLGKYASWINYPMFEYFPFFDAFRAPETWLSITALGLAILAGIGLDYCLRREDGRKQEKTRSMLYVFGAVLGVVLLLRVGPNLFFDFEKPNERQRLVRAIQQQRPNLSIQSQRVQRFIRQQMEQRKKKRVSAFKADATRTIMAVGMVLLLLWLYRRKTVAAWVAGGAIVLVVTIDLWGVDKRYLGEDQFSTQPDRESKISTYDYHRFLDKQVDRAGGTGRFRVFPLQPPQRRTPMNNPISSYHYESVGGAHPAKLQIYQDYIDHILQGSGRGLPNENALDLMNARYIVAQQRLPGTSVIYQSQETNVLVLENADAVPRGFLVGQTEVIEDPQSTWQRLRESSFDPRRTAILPEPLDPSVAPIDSGSTAEVTMDSHSLEEIKWTIQTDAPRLFVASEVYYPAGWNAYLNGEEVPIQRVNYLLRGVHMPEGKHTLVLRFEPKADSYGTLVAGGTTLLVYGGVLFLLARRHRRWWEGLIDSVRGEQAEATG